MEELTTKESTKKRLEEIEKELSLLNEKHLLLKNSWEKEKRFIQMIRTTKAEIEEYKKQSDEFERQGNLGRVAEIRYGTLLELEKKTEGC